MSFGIIKIVEYILIGRWRWPIIREKKSISIVPLWQLRWPKAWASYVRMMCIISPSTPLCIPNGISAASQITRSKQSWPLKPALQKETANNRIQYNVFVLSEKPVASRFMNNKLNNYAFNFLSMDLYRFVRVTRLRLDTDECDDVVTWSSLFSLSWCSVCDSVFLLFVSNDRTKSSCKLWNFKWILWFSEFWGRAYPSQWPWNIIWSLVWTVVVCFEIVWQKYILSVI